MANYHSSAAFLFQKLHCFLSNLLTFWSSLNICALVAWSNNIKIVIKGQIECDYVTNESSGITSGNFIYSSQHSRSNDFWKFIICIIINMLQVPHTYSYYSVESVLISLPYLSHQHFIHFLVISSWWPHQTCSKAALSYLNASHPFHCAAPALKSYSFPLQSSFSSPFLFALTLCTKILI